MTCLTQICFRLSEWREDTLLWIHRCFIGLASLAMTSVYCTYNLGICRPLPMFYYLIGSSQEIEFKRDLISLGFMSSFVITVSALQISIEVKKWKLSSEAKKADKAAKAAKRHLNEAKLKLAFYEMLKNEQEGDGDSNLGLEQLLNSCNGSSDSQTTQIEVCEEYNTTKTNNNVLKLTRIITMLAVILATTVITIFSLEGMDNWRPHGSTALTMIAFGNVVPIFSLLNNTKMRKFAFDIIKTKSRKFIRVHRSTRIEPMVTVNC